MEPSHLRAGFRRAITSTCRPAKRRLPLHPRRYYATPTQDSQPAIRAAPPIRFDSDTNQFARPRAEIISSGRRNNTITNNNNNRQSGSNSQQEPPDHLLARIRILPASPSYFTATPRYTDDLLYLSSLLRKYQLLPQSAPGEQPRIAWKTLLQYRTEVGEPVRAKGYSALLTLLKRLNQIHPSLFPQDVQRALQRYKRLIQPSLNEAKPIHVDEFGRTKAAGRRKSSRAMVWLVEGEGQCMINGKSLTEYFGRLHDRESAVWALKATQRLDKYNVWCIARGGGTTGQAEAVQLGLAKALLAHEPDLKPALRRAGVVTRDPRRVERKKPGKLKARKMPAWVKR